MSEYHIFDTRLAKRYGILESIILCHFRFWIEKNKANDRHFHDGRYWTYTTVAALAQIIDYASPKQLRRALDHLIAEGVLLTGNYNNSAYDRTLWYAFSDLENGVVDVLIVDEIAGRFEMSKVPSKFDPIEVTIGPVTEIGIGFRKDDTALRDEVQTAFDSIIKDGTARKISEQWFQADLIKLHR